MSYTESKIKKYFPRDLQILLTNSCLSTCLFIGFANLLRITVQMEKKCRLGAERLVLLTSDLEDLGSDPAGEFNLTVPGYIV